MGTLGGLTTSSAVFELLGTVMYTINQTGDAKDKHISAKEADKINVSEMTGVNNHDAKDDTAETAKNPNEAVGRVNRGTKTNQDFEGATNQSVGGHKRDVPNHTFVHKKQQGNTKSGVKDCHENRNQPAFVNAAAIERIGKFDNGERKQGDANDRDQASRSFA